MKFFITGIAGFIGSAMARHLLDVGHDVFGVDNLHTGRIANVPPGAEWHRVDISDEKMLAATGKTCDIVLHFAAQTSAEKSFLDPLYDFDTNYRGTYNAFVVAMEMGARLMVNMSSMSVYGDVRSTQPVDELCPPSPSSLYGTSKHAAETMLSLLSNRFGLPVVSLRLFNAYGPGQNLDEMKQGMASIFLAQLIRDRYHEVLVRGNLSRIRDFVYIDDIVAAIMAVVDSGTPESGIYNLCTGKTHSVGRLIELLKAETGIDKPVVVDGETAGDIHGFPGDVDRFAEVFRCRPQTRLEDGIRKMAISYGTTIRRSVIQQ